jgi:XTP/dITP diphosphohydrolase
VGRHLLCLATTNRGKVREFRDLLSELNLDIVAMNDLLPRRLTIHESGTTFRDNAIKKAMVAAQETHTLCLADDSGLSVDVLGGAPGVFSARFAREGASDAENNAALLRALEERAPGVPDVELRARFTCALAVVDPFAADKEPLVVVGACEGHIARHARGDGGFGYDRHFVVDGRKETMAELSEHDKGVLSHRGRAVVQLIPLLGELVNERERRIRSVEG